MNMRTQQRWQLTDHPANDTTPTWSPDGTEIAFISNRSGKYRVYKMDINGEKLNQLTKGGNDWGAPLGPRMANGSHTIHSSPTIRFTSLLYPLMAGSRNNWQWLERTDAVQHGHRMRRRGDCLFHLGTWDRSKDCHYRYRERETPSCDALVGAPLRGRAFRRVQSSVVTGWKVDRLHFG